MKRNPAIITRNSASAELPFDVTDAQKIPYADTRTEETRSTGSETKKSGPSIRLFAKAVTEKSRKEQDQAERTARHGSLNQEV